MSSSSLFGYGCHPSFPWVLAATRHRDNSRQKFYLTNKRMMRLVTLRVLNFCSSVCVCLLEYVCINNRNSYLSYTKFMSLVFNRTVQFTFFYIEIPIQFSFSQSYSNN